VGAFRIGRLGRLCKLSHGNDAVECAGLHTLVTLYGVWWGELPLPDLHLSSHAQL